MRVRITAATGVLLLAALTACGGEGDSSSKPEAAPTSEPAQSSEPSPGTVEESAKLGTPARTTGDGGTGVLEITPDTVVFTKQGGSETSANGTFVVVTMKDKAMTAVAADEPAPITGQGWKWMAPDGEMIGWDSGNSTNVTLGKFENADPVQPGAWQWRSQVFDLTPEQAKGGVLIYIDGEDKAHRWQMPSTDSGPNVAAVKKELQP